jgi:hypothetical protein
LTDKEREHTFRIDGASSTTRNRSCRPTHFKVVVDGATDREIVATIVLGGEAVAFGVRGLELDTSVDGCRTVVSSFLGSTSIGFLVATTAALGDVDDDCCSTSDTVPGIFRNDALACGCDSRKDFGLVDAMMPRSG